MSVCGKWSACVGRVLLSFIFVMSGVQKIMAPDETATLMKNEGLPAVQFLLIGAIVCELAGGLSVMLGVKARWGAALLIIFLIPTTLIMHDFWTYEGQQQQMQMAHFMKNLAILGGLLLIVGIGPGGCCLWDGRRPSESP